MSLSTKAIATAAGLVLLIVLGTSAWEYFTYGGLKGSFLSIVCILAVYGFSASAICVLLANLWRKDPN